MNDEETHVDASTDQETETDLDDTEPDLDSKFGVNPFGETVFMASTSAVETSTSQLTASSDAEKPVMIGRYEIRGVLGTGRFGTVYEAFDNQLNRRLAIKVPLTRTTRDQQQLFLQEARQLAQLRHPSIVTVHDVGVDGGDCFIVSEYLEGRDLNRWLVDRKLSWQDAAQVVISLAEGLAVAHSQGIIHRDVKPGNIIMTERDGEFLPVLVDFGLALSQTSATSPEGQRGLVLGTPNYMSPEQARGEGHRIDGRTDLYALGVVLYRLLSGQLPFSAPTLSALLKVVISDEPRPPRQFVRGLPRELERICLKTMAKAVSDRYTTAGDLASDLRKLLRQHSDQLEHASVPSRGKDRPAPREATKILIVDDQEIIRFKLQSDLEKWGHQVTAAEDGEQAWELFQKARFSIVITDWMMPNMSGLELVQMIRSAGLEEYVYIIMLTARAEKHDIVAGMGAGADDFLAKPFHRDELQVRVRAGIRITTLNRALNESNRKMQRTQEAASRIRKLFLPTIRPHLPGIELAWEHDSTDDLGGDMFNVVPLDPDHVGLFVLDMASKGLPALLAATTLNRLMSPPSDSASILVERGSDGSVCRLRQPAEVARELNRQLSAQEEKSIVSLAYGILDLKSREFRFTSAGHPPLLHLRSGASASLLDIDGYPLGMTPDSEEFHQKTVSLDRDDRLFIYSDGLPDTMNEEGEVFGAARLLESASRLAREPLPTQLRSLMKEIHEWTGDAERKDDASVLAVQV